ncbi:PQQ-binding-like beta-propeller repeat protein [Halosegnis marinus]|uniref:PQQ-binding-like beta-propeller repeat protein n=2 Tax=Halosegnis marinus TaxID=3034023 RepID=A0ABD5ZRR0_9EURY|nr:PQQ-binding-like beta-propeller repeat protein [Halosegnis sp. DT85]
MSAFFAGASTGCLGLLGPSSERVRWRRGISGRPHLADGTLYAMDRLRLHALSPTDGETRWKTGWDAEAFEADAERDGSLCLSTGLAAEGERVYVAGCDGVRALYRSDGNREWFVETSLRPAQCRRGSDRLIVFRMYMGILRVFESEPTS